MQRIALPCAMELSRIIYGMWRLGDVSDTSAAHVQEKIEACLSQGITSFDQADIYGDYESEKLLGAALKVAPQLREKMEIITKCDIKLLSDKFPNRRVKYYDTSREHIEASVNASLQNMATDYIDLLLIHRPDPLMDADETGAALDAVIASGKVRAVGVSNFKSYDWELLQGSLQAKLQTNQIEISLTESNCFRNGDIAFLQKNRIPPMAWSPLAGGSLMSGSDPLQQRLGELAGDAGVQPEAIAVAWLLKHPSNIMPVLGTNNMQRISQLSDATKVEMDRETWFELYTLALGEEVP